MPDPVAVILDGLRFGVLAEVEEVLGLAEGLLAGAVPGVAGFLVADDIAPGRQCGLRCSAGVAWYRSFTSDKARFQQSMMRLSVLRIERLIANDADVG